jgi:hypothetical protein
MASIKYLVDLDLNKQQLLNAVVQNLASAPGSPSDGQIYWNTVLNSLFVYRAVGAVWVDLGASGVTNLAYTASPTNGVVTSDTGADATIPLATTIDAGLLAPGDKTKINATSGSNTGDNATNTQYSGLVSNVQTNLSEGTTTATTVNVNSSDGTNATLLQASGTRAGVMSSADKSKLDGVEPLADVTDAANVNAAGAVMESDISGTPSGRIINDNTFGTASNTTLATSASTKAYIDNLVVGGMIYKGAYSASANTPALDASDGATIATKVGDTYTVTTAGTFFLEAVQVGDVIICEVANATTAADWTIVNKNIPDIVSASETAQGIIELATAAEVAAGTDTIRAITPANLSSITKLGTITVGDVTAVVSPASETLAGKIEIATQAEVTAGTDDVRAITPLKLKAALGTTGTLSMARKYTQTIGDGVALTYAVPHGLASTTLVAEVYRSASPFDKVQTEVIHTNTTLLTINFNVAPTTGQYTVVIIG